MSATGILSLEQYDQLLELLQERLAKAPAAIHQPDWEALGKLLRERPESAWSLWQMEATGGEPALLEFDATEGSYLFIDSSRQSPAGRRSLCYDRAAWNARKANKPADTVEDQVAAMGVELCDEAWYRKAQAQYGPFDTTTSSWIKTPEAIRSLGGALFCDHRFGTIFVYHNGADSYYAARGFRALLQL